MNTLSSLSFELHTLCQSIPRACAIKRYLDNVVGMFRKIPKIASSSKSSVGALSQASRNPNGSWQGIWNAVSCSMLLQGSSQGESTALEKPKAQALKGTFSPNLRGDLKTETGHAGPA